MAAVRHRFPDEIEAKDVKGVIKRKFHYLYSHSESRYVGCAGVFAIVRSTKKTFPRLSSPKHCARNGACWRYCCDLARHSKVYVITGFA